MIDFVIRAIILAVVLYIVYLLIGWVLVALAIGGATLLPIIGVLLLLGFLYWLYLNFPRNPLP